MSPAVENRPPEGFGTAVGTARVAPPLGGLELAVVGAFVELGERGRAARR